MLRRKKAKSARAKRSKSESLRSLVAKCDREFSRYIRMKYADEGGTVECVTCGKLLHFKEAHASHFVSRRHMALRWHEANVHPCCPRCNVFESGALDEYSRFIINTYGMTVFESLLAEKRKVRKWTRPELQTLYEYYKAAAREQEARFSGYVG